MSDTRDIYLAKGHRLHNSKYRIEKKIGQDVFGITYLGSRCAEQGESVAGSAIMINEFYWGEYCSRQNDGQTVSIHSSIDDAIFLRFKEKLKTQGDLLSKLQHPNIAKMVDMFEENNTVYLVMQYIEGYSLEQIVEKNGRLHEPDVKKYANQLCAALTEIHRQNILHLDIKPSNILIDKDNNVQVIDFGMSKQYSPQNMEVVSATPFGISRGYSPMEQYSGITKFSPSADIYALGATLYYLLTGKVPLESTLRITEDLEPITAYNSHVSESLDQAIKKAMEIKPRDRFQTLVEFKNAMSDKEADFWDGAQAINTIQGFEYYLKQYPQGKYADEANNIIAEIRARNAAKEMREQSTQIKTEEVTEKIKVTPPTTQAAVVEAPPAIANVYSSTLVVEHETDISPPRRLPVALLSLLCIGLIIIGIFYLYPRSGEVDNVSEIRGEVINLIGENKVFWVGDNSPDCLHLYADCIKMQTGKNNSASDGTVDQASEIFANAPLALCAVCEERANIDKTVQFLAFSKQALEYYDFAVKTDEEYFSYALEFCSKALRLQPNNQDMLDLKQKIESRKKL